MSDGDESKLLGFDCFTVCFLRYTLGGGGLLVVGNPTPLCLARHV